MIHKVVSNFYSIPYLSSHTPNIRFLSFPFYLNHIGYLCTNEGYYLEMEGMDYYFFGLTLSGSGMVEFKDSNYCLTAGTAFFLDCNEYFKIGTTKGQKWDFKWIYFKGTACKEYYKLINNESFQIVTMSDAAIGSSLIDELYRLTQNNGHMVDVEIPLIITRLLTNMVTSRYSYEYISIKKSNEIKQALDYIINNYSNNIKITDICNEIYLSKSHLIKLFRMHLNTTPHEYITKFRIDKSKKLLLETQISIGEISQLIGFETASLFISNFKKYTGVTPQKFRKSIFFFS